MLIRAFSLFEGEHGVCHWVTGRGGLTGAGGAVNPAAMQLRNRIPLIPHYTFGTGRIRATVDTFAEDVKLVRGVMETGVAVHTSSDYGHGGHDVQPFGGGQTLKVLKAAFAEAPQQIPKIIVKLYCATVENARGHLEMILAGLGVERIDVAQLCTWADFAEDFGQQGPRWQMFNEFQEKGVIGNYLAEIFAPWSQNALPVIEEKLVDGVIFYYNLIERQVSNEVWDRIEAKNTLVFALRTLGGICPDMERLDETLTGQGEDSMSARLAALKPLYKQSGCRNWVEFSMRFALSMPNVVTTIGATNKLQHVQAFLAAEKRPLPQDVLKQIHTLHREAGNTQEK